VSADTGTKVPIQKNTVIASNIAYESLKIFALIMIDPLSLNPWQM
jgi:hypothetical protein